MSFTLGLDINSLKDLLENIPSGDAEEQNIRAAKLHTDFGVDLTSRLFREIRAKKDQMVEQFKWVLSNMQDPEQNN